jgi:hypothetical protein
LAQTLIFTNAQPKQMAEPNNEANVILALQAIQNNPKLSLRRAAAIYNVLFITLPARQTGWFF